MDEFGCRTGSNFLHRKDFRAATAYREGGGEGGNVTLGRS
jgi:hypothetical protein